MKQQQQNLIKELKQEKVKCLVHNMLVKRRWIGYENQSSEIRTEFFVAAFSKAFYVSETLHYWITMFRICF